MPAASTTVLLAPRTTPPLLLASLCLLLLPFAAAIPSFAAVPSLLFPGGLNEEVIPNCTDDYIIIKCISAAEKSGKLRLLTHSRQSPDTWYMVGQVDADFNNSRIKDFLMVSRLVLHNVYRIELFIEAEPAETYRSRYYYCTLDGFEEVDGPCGRAGRIGRGDCLRTVFFGFSILCALLFGCCVLWLLLLRLKILRRG